MFNLWVGGGGSVVSAYLCSRSLRYQKGNSQPPLQGQLCIPKLEPHDGQGVALDQSSMIREKIWTEKEDRVTSSGTY